MKKLILGLSIFAVMGVSGIKAAVTLNHPQTVTVADGKDGDESKKKKDTNKKSCETKSTESKSTRSCCSKQKATACGGSETKAQ